VAVPRFTYGAEVWYTYLHKLEGANKTKGSVAVTNKLHSMQRKVAKAITGGLSSTPGDILDVHAYILPIDLLFCKLLFRATLRLCSLPPVHPLHPLVQSVTRQKIKRHLSPIHHLICFAHVNPKEVEIVFAVRRSPGYAPAFDLVIPLSKDDALSFAIITNTMAPVCIYSNGWASRVALVPLLSSTSMNDWSRCFEPTLVLPKSIQFMRQRVLASLWAFTSLMA
jgi:hypothetical protein